MSKKRKHKPTSSKVTTANQANAQHSTGPKTQPGKEKSAKNSFKHGLTSKTFKLLAWEDPEEYAAFKADYFERLAPANAEAAALVTTLVQLRWQILRTFTLETQIMEVGWDDPQSCIRDLDRLQRYRASMERQIRRTTQDLEDLKSPPLTLSMAIRPSTKPQASAKTPRPGFEHLPPNAMQLLSNLGQEILRQKADNPNGGDPDLILLFHAIRNGEVASDLVDALLETGSFCQNAS